MPGPETTPAKGIRAWTLQIIQDRIKALITAVTGAEENQQFYDGDHWQSGQGWIGPQPSPTDRGAPVIFKLLQSVFTSKNVVREVVQRHTLGIVGVEPSFALVPNRAMLKDEKPKPEEQTKIDEAEAILTAWWNSRKVHKLIQDVVARVMHQERAVLRFYVPIGLLKTERRGEIDVQVLPFAPVNESIENLWLDSPDNKNAAVVRDPLTMQEVGLLIYKQQNDDGTEGDEVVQLVFVDGDNTILRTMKDAAGLEVTLDLGKRLTMYQVEQPTFISEQVRQAQRALNFAATCIPRLLSQAGWLERLILNGEPPGDWEYNPDGSQIAGSFKVKPYPTGPNVTNWVRGFEMVDEETGKKTLTDPQAVFREPVGIDGPVDAKREHYSDILEEVDQTHILLADSAAPSGRRVEQAREDHKSRLNVTRSAVEPMVAWIVMTVLAISEALAGKPGFYTSMLRCAATCRLSLGPLTSDERGADQTSVEKSLMSRETAMERSGVVDVDAENARIAADPGAQLDVKTKQMTIVTSATTAGSTLQGAAEFAGVEGEDLTKLTEQPDFEDNTEDDTGDPPVPRLVSSGA